MCGSVFVELSVGPGGASLQHHPCTAILTDIDHGAMGEGRLEPY